MEKNSKTRPGATAGSAAGGTLGGMKLAHLSDTHLGYRAYEALTPRGNNQREADIVSAFRQTVRAIGEWEPDLVIHAGDVADAARIDHRMMLVAKAELTKLTAGGERPVVVIAGNHDAPRSRRDVCFLELFSDIPGLHIVTQGYEQVDLGDVVVHAIPHDSLKTLNFDEVRPVAGKRNVLTSHGVAESTELFLRAVGREFAIPAEVMLRDWDYVALGHWHKRGAVNLGGDHSLSSGRRSRVWYAGSTENISFRDLRDDSGMERGWIAVTMNSELDIDPRNVAIRQMFRLAALDGEGMGPDQITAELLGRLEEAEIRGAVVGQVVTGVSRDIWALVDHVRVRGAARDALHYQITLRPVRAEAVATSGEGGEGGGAGLGQIDSLVAEILSKKVAKEEVETVGTLVSTFLKEALGEEHEEDKKASSDDKAGDKTGGGQQEDLLAAASAEEAVTEAETEVVTAAETSTEPSSETSTETSAGPATGDEMGPGGEEAA